MRGIEIQISIPDEHPSHAGGACDEDSDPVCVGSWRVCPRSRRVSTQAGCEKARAFVQGQHPNTDAMCVPKQ